MKVKVKVNATIYAGYAPGSVGVPLSSYAGKVGVAETSGAGVGYEVFVRFSESEGASFMWNELEVLQ